MTTTGRIISIDLSVRGTTLLGQLPTDLLSGASRPTLHLSFDGSAAFDIAGTGRAEHVSLRSAFDEALILTRHRSAMAL